MRAFLLLLFTACAPLSASPGVITEPPFDDDAGAPALSSSPACDNLCARHCNDWCPSGVAACTSGLAQLKESGITVDVTCLAKTDCDSAKGCTR